MIILGPKTAILGPQFCRILVLGPHFWWSGGAGSPGPPMDPPLCNETNMKELHVWDQNSDQFGRFLIGPEFLEKVNKRVSNYCIGTQVREALLDLKCTAVPLGPSIPQCLRHFDYLSHERDYEHH